MLPLHTLIVHPFFRQLLHELSLGDKPLLNEGLRHGISLREAGMTTLTVEMKGKGTFQ